MKFLLDECLPAGTKNIFKSFGHSCISAREANLLGKPDHYYIDFANRTKRILVTLDTDFSNILVFKPGSYPGIIILRPLLFRTSENIYQVLKRFLNELNNINIERALVIVTNKKIRIRR